MALTVEFKVLDNVTIGATEYSVYNNSTTIATATDDGVFQLFVWDNGNMTKTEEYQIRILEKVHNGGTQEQVFKATIKGDQSEVFVTPPLCLGNGWDMTLKKIAGTDRAFDVRISQLG